MARPMTFDADVVIDHAVGIFWRQGFAATTPQNLVDELGIGKGSLYNTFKSKHHLFTLALRHYSQQRMDELATGLEGPGALKPRLREALATLAGVGEHQLGCLTVNAVAEVGMADAAVAEIATELFERMQEIFRSAIKRGQESGEIAATRAPAAAAGALMAAAIGTAVLAKAGTSPTQLRRILDAAVDI
ncbi:TetR/AcrR family transcriptional regulator [Kribbella antibiotica]|uniref:TetR/AcrR family transcriptional regulator n=1 Tax=Kribbella antibiotica TaxID=190195 RepID=A0A4R4ZX86_9ACTN|nr:TetR/AcrR family transcriptional regulator [Kribbella antibiotica]TDD62914.1 TetR/AcrR family transcriptional regulator [Kribbella antibiotica]